jgi:hypothetical protein
MSTDLVKSGHASIDLISGDNFERVERVATGLAASGMFKGVTDTQTAMAKILLGADMGLTPTQALLSIDVVKGNVQIRGKRLLAWVRQSENYDYEVIERTDEKGVLRFFEKSKRVGDWKVCGPDIAFTREEAKAKGLISEQSAWSKWPANMCLWRCASIGVNLYCPDLVGGVPVYTEADSFDSTAVEIGAGEGSGEAPEWKGVSEEHVAKIEDLMARAAAAEFPGLADMATVRMRLNGQSESAVAEWIAAAEEQMRAVEGGAS